MMKKEPIKQPIKEPIQLNVTDLTNKGQGIAHYQGKVFFIDDVLPGDQVLVNNHHDHGTWAEASDFILETPSPLRQPSPCAYSDHCGGCQWLELPYDAQLRWKAVFIRDALTRIGKLSYDEEITVQPSAARLQYRNRVLLRGGIDSEGAIVLGYFRKKTRDLVSISRCMIADEEINHLIAQLLRMKVPGVRPQKFRLSVQVVDLYKGRQKACLLVTLHEVEGRNHGLEPLVAAVQQLPQVLWCGMREELKNLHLVPFEGSTERPLYTAPEQFQQVNLPQNLWLRHVVATEVEGLPAPATVVDLFCGTGNLSLGLADPSRRIVGVELNAQAISIARYMVKRYQLPNIEYRDLGADKFLKSWRAGGIDLLIADPPRAGMKECIPELLRLRPRVIVYISCDAVTMARDIGKLAMAYQICSVRGFDFFPQTPHVETVAVLKLLHP